MLKKKNWRIFYPLLVGLYPIIGLIGVNITQIILLAALRSLLLSAVLVMAVYAFFSWQIRDEHKAALMSAVFFVFFYFYGHVYDVVKGWKAGSFLIGRHLIIFPLWLLIFGLAEWLIHRQARVPVQISRILNIVGVVLLIYPVYQIALFEWKRDHPSVTPAPANLSFQGKTIQSLQQLPDIYYIILDQYARDDMLLEYYNLDTSGFIHQLRDIGFYVPMCSQSNYPETALSLASSLNMNTVDKIVPEAFRKGETATVTEFLSELGNAIRHSTVRQAFEKMGYKTVSFQNEIWWTQWPDANYYITDKSRPYEMVTNFRKITEFEVLFVRTTVLRIFEEARAKWLAPLTNKVESPEKQHAEYVLLALNELDKIPRNVPSPKLVFAHIVSPHEPFVFDPDGNFVVTTNYDPGYPNQVVYLNKRLISLVKSIIAQSTNPPIIVLQADHGRDNEVREAIFMAIYFPNGGNSVLYPTLTPVNIFRLLFNTYFGQSFPLVPDISYLSDTYTSYRFTEVTYPCNPNR